MAKTCSRPVYHRRNPVVNRWKCRHCGFVAWGPDDATMTDRIQAHLAEHHRDAIEQDDCRRSRTNSDWGRIKHTHDGAEGIEAFERHRSSHVEPLREEGVHVADEVGGSGDVLVASPPESAGADNARIHFVSACDFAIIVTTNPRTRIRLLQERLEALPAWTVVITTDKRPLESRSGLDVASLPVEIVPIEGTFGLANLGKTISRVVSAHPSDSGSLTVEFDMLAEILSKFSLQEVFRFLNVLSSRLADADTLAHYYLDPGTESNWTVNLLRELFDLTIQTSGTVFTTVE